MTCCEETPAGSVMPSLCERNAAAADSVTTHNAAIAIWRIPEILLATNSGDLVGDKRSGFHVDSSPCPTCCVRRCLILSRRSNATARARNQLAFLPSAAAGRLVGSACWTSRKCLWRDPLHRSRASSNGRRRGRDLPLPFPSRLLSQLRLSQSVMHSFQVLPRFLR